MKLTDKQLKEVMAAYVARITVELEEVNQKGRVEEYFKLHKYESIIKDDCATYFVKPEQRILVIGDIRFDKKMIDKIAEEYAIEPSQIDVIDKYKQISRYDFDALIDTTKYSDIIVGAVPHKTKGTNGASGIVAHIMNNKHRYPNIVIASTGNDIKLTLNTFTKALLKTRYYSFLCL